MPVPQGDVFSHGATTSSLGVHEQELSMAAFDMQAFGITQHQILNSIERLLSGQCRIENRIMDKLDRHQRQMEAMMPRWDQRFGDRLITIQTEEKPSDGSSEVQSQGVSARPSEGPPEGRSERPSERPRSGVSSVEPGNFRGTRKTLTSRLTSATDDTNFSSPQTRQHFSDQVDVTVPPTLPVSWPQSLHRRCDLDEVVEMSRSCGVQSAVSPKASASRAMLGRSGGGVWEGPLWIPMAINPNTPTRLVIDLVSIFVLVSDLTLVPFVLAWNLPVDGYLAVFTWCTVSYWTLDIVLNFFTGYQVKGEVEMRLSKVARHYLRTSFSIDCVIVVCDWASTLASLVVGYNDEARGLRLLRVAKVQQGS